MPLRAKMLDGGTNTKMSDETNQTTEQETPQWEHHSCPGCKFLGRHGNKDLYVCTGRIPGGTNTIISRYGDNSWDYESGMFFKNDSYYPALMEAYKRAVQAGHLEVDQQPKEDTTPDESWLPFVLHMRNGTVEGKNVWAWWVDDEESEESEEIFAGMSVCPEDAANDARILLEESGRIKAATKEHDG